MTGRPEEGTLQLSPYYRRLANDRARMQTVDGYGVSARTRENLATNTNSLRSGDLSAMLGS